MANQAKISIAAILLIAGLCALSSCALQREISASGLTRNEVRALPYWRAADSLTGAENRWADAWCEIASGERRGI